MTVETPSTRRGDGKDTVRGRSVVGGEKSGVALFVAMVSSDDDSLI